MSAGEDALPPYRHAGARALVLLHERELRAFVDRWRAARAVDLTLPASDDPNYASLDHLLAHVLRCARSYLTWSCEQLGLDDPGVRPEPPAASIAAEADAYLEHVLERWRTPLKDLTEEASEHPEYPSLWGPRYCIDAMLEHAVMHPIRHRFQLESLLEGR
ncbi:MAG: hypothetical protein ACF8XB_01605 [Planctomycetota bacterium JB042]